MTRSTDRILTTHVGSLIRPAPLQEFLRAKQAGKSYDRVTYEACLKSSVAEVVREQADVGSMSSAMASSANQSAGPNMCSNA
jgi:5-methyltetrahydropteroyltriglutamate--homocysteine methyltransferase